jgi:hypothetical protein
MTKKQKVEEAIEKTEIELDRLKLLLKSVKGDALEVCPECKTKNRHWYAKDFWCCAFC